MRDTHTSSSMEETIHGNFGRCRALWESIRDDAPTFLPCRDCVARELHRPAHSIAAADAISDSQRIGTILDMIEVYIGSDEYILEV